MKNRTTEFCPIGSPHQEQITDQIIKIGQKRTASKNCTIFEKNQTACGIYLIKKGNVKISRTSIDGKEILIEILSPGKIFGENGVFGRGQHSETATAITECEFFFLHKIELKKILSNNPELYQSIAQSLCKSIDRLNDAIENISLPSAKERVSVYLKKLQQEQQSILINLAGKKHEIASLLGLRPETFSRALTELEDNGLIKMNHRQIQILIPSKI